jgi:hypothetical protein
VVLDDDGGQAVVESEAVHALRRRISCGGEGEGQESEDGQGWRIRAVDLLERQPMLCPASAAA